MPVKTNHVYEMILEYLHIKYTYTYTEYQYPGNVFNALDKAQRKRLNKNKQTKTHETIQEFWNVK